MPVRRLRDLVFLLLVLLLPQGCERSQPPVEFNQTVYTFGTLVEVTIVGVPETVAENAYGAILEDFNFMHNTWHAWQINAMSRINNLLRTGKVFSLAPSVLPLILEAKNLSAQSDGLFNPAIGKLVRLWGFHTDDHDELMALPDENAIRELINARPGMQDVLIEGLRMHGTNDKIHLDFGGFAKGYAVDVAIEHLRELGIHNAIINAGGDLRAIGKHGDRAWRIGIRDPRGEGVYAALEIEGDESVFTSGDYERFFEEDGQRYHHIIDPRTGYPAKGVRSVTVIHSNGATADAAATALFVAGTSDWHRIARAMGIKYVMLLDEQGRAHMNPAMQQRIRFVGNKPEIIISPPL